MSVSRRKFISMLAGTGAVAAATTLTGCRPVSDPSGQGWLPNQYRDQSTFKPPVRGRVAFSPDDPALVRDDEKCILCGQCIEACEKVQSVFGYYELPVYDDFICVHCGSVPCGVRQVPSMNAARLTKCSLPSTTRNILLLHSHLLPHV